MVTHAYPVAVCFPYREDGGDRDRIADWIEQRWRQLFSDFQIVRGRSAASLPFNRSQAINDAFRQTRSGVILIADLDTIFHVAQVEAAVAAIEGGEKWGYAFRGYFNLTPSYSRDLLALPCTRDFPLEDSRFLHHGFENVSGLTAVSREAFKRTGGFDEGFVGWGFEDLAFDKVARARLGAPFRIEDYLLHLWHPSSDVPKTTVANQQRYEEVYIQGESKVFSMPGWL